MGMKILSTSAAITVDELKDHCNIDDSEDGNFVSAPDAVLQRAVNSASRYFENATKTAIGEATITFTLSEFPWTNEIQIPRPPLQSVTSIRYIDPDGDQQTLSTSVYSVDTIAQPGRVVLKPGQSWPKTSAVPNAIEIALVAGYAVNDIPTLLKQGVLLMAAHYFENREGATDRRIDAIPLGVQSIVDQFMFIEVF